MDRALCPVKKVAANVTHKDSGYAALSNEQLATEVQKFAGYNHLSRSGANLLEEVIRRLVLAKEITKDDIVRLDMEGLMDKVITGYDIKPLNQSAFIVKFDEASIKKAVSWLPPQASTDISEADKRKAVISSAFMTSWPPAPRFVGTEMIGRDPINFDSIARQVMAMLERSDIPWIFESKHPLQVNYSIDQDACLVMSVHWQHPERADGLPGLYIESKIPLVAIKLEGNTGAVLLVAHPFCEYNFITHDVLEVNEHEFSGLSKRNDAVHIAFVARPDLANDVFWAALKKQVLDLPDETLNSIFGSSKPTDLFGRLKAVVSPDHLEEIKKLNAMFVCYFTSTPGQGSVPVRHVAFTWRSVSKAYRACFTLPQKHPAEGNKRRPSFVGLSDLNIRDYGVCEFFTRLQINPAKEPILELRIPVKELSTPHGLHSILDKHFDRTTAAVGWPVVLGTSPETHQRIADYLQRTGGNPIKIIDMMLEHAHKNNYEIRLRLWGELDETFKGVAIDYVAADGKVIPLSTTMGSV